MDRLGAFDDGEPGPELTRDWPDDRALVRRAGAQGMVLLRNEAVGAAARAAAHAPATCDVWP